MNAKISDRSLESCIFCGKPEKLTGEHVFADWIGGVWNGGNLTRTDRSLALRGGKPVTTSITQRHEDEKLNVLCHGCNSVWGSRKQSTAKRHIAPLILGQWPRMNEDAKRIIAWWATSFAMVREFMHPELVVTSQLAREDFRRTYSPPPGWRIWMRPYEGYRHLESRHLALEVLGGAGVPNVLLQQFVAGKIVFVVFGPISSDLSSYTSTPSHCLANALIYHRFVEIYPTHKFFQKVPPRPIGDDEYENLLDIFVDAMTNPLEWIRRRRPPNETINYRPKRYGPANIRNAPHWFFIKK